MRRRMFVRPYFDGQAIYSRHYESSNMFILWRNRTISKLFPEKGFAKLIDEFIINFHLCSGHFQASSTPGESKLIDDAQSTLIIEVCNWTESRRNDASICQHYS